MKIRTDFVTNSSSSSFTVSIGVNLSSGHKIHMRASGDNGDYYYSTEYQLSIKNSKNREIYQNLIYVADENVADLLDKESSTYDYDWFIIESNFYDVVNCYRRNNIADILASDDPQKRIADVACFGKINLGIYDGYDDDEPMGEKVADLCEEYNSMMSEYKKIASKYLTTSRDISDMTLFLDFSGWGGDYVDFRTPQGILESIFDHQRAEEITDKIGDDKIASVNNLRSLPFLEKFTDSALEAIVNFITKCKYYVPNDTWVEQKLVNNGSIDMTIEWSNEPL